MDIAYVSGPFKKKKKLFSNILGTFHLFLVLLVLIE